MSEKVVIAIIVLLFIFAVIGITDKKVQINDELQLKLEDLKEENDFLKEKKSELSCKLEDLQKKYEYDEELIDLLQRQLKSHGIEPDEL